MADEGFMKGMTSWEPELVSEHPAVVVREIEIDDLYGYLMDEVKAGNIILNLYKSSKEYKSMISNHIFDRIIRFEVLDGKIPDKLISKFPKLINQLEKINNGYYLLAMERSPLKDVEIEVLLKAEIGRASCRERV